MKHLFLGLTIVIAAAGCARMEVLALPNRESAELTADDIVRVLQRSGLTDEQIVEVGTEVRNALALTGAAQVRFENVTHLMISVNHPYLNVSTYMHGAFIYDLRTGQIK